MHSETIIDHVDVDVDVDVVLVLVLVLLCAPLAPVRRVSFACRTWAGTSNHASTRPRASTSRHLRLTTHDSQPASCGTMRTSGAWESSVPGT